MEKYMVIMPSGEIRWELVEPAERMQRFYEIIGTDCVENVYTILPDICIIVDESGKIKNPPQQAIFKVFRIINHLKRREEIHGKHEQRKCKSERM